MIIIRPLSKFILITDLYKSIHHRTIYTLLYNMTEKTQSQLMRMLGKVAQKFPQTEEPVVMTDLHLRVNQETGDVMVFDDDDNEITRIVVDEWIGNNEEDTVFYKKVAKGLRQLLLKDNFGSSLGIIMPYSFVLENETGEHIDELFIADTDDTIIIGGGFMENLEKDLDDFLQHLMDEK